MIYLIPNSCSPLSLKIKDNKLISNNLTLTQPLSLRLFAVCFYFNNTSLLNDLLLFYSKGTMMTCLATGQYGELLKMRVSHDGHQMALLITTRDQSYVCALSLKLNRVLTFHRHPGCRDFALSTNCDFIATEAKGKHFKCYLSFKSFVKYGLTMIYVDI